MLPLGTPRTRCAARGGGYECRGCWGWGCEWGIKGLTPSAALPVSGALLGRGRAEGGGGLGAELREGNGEWEGRKGGENGS